jgi:hypothetical protein
VTVERFAARRAALEAEIARLTAKLVAHGAEVTDWDVIGFTNWDAGYPFIWIDDGGRLHWIVRERGRTLQDRVTDDESELLFWCFDSTTRAVAPRGGAAPHEARRRDTRPAWWREQGRLLNLLCPAWAVRWRAELAAFLIQHGQGEDVALIPQVP